MSDIKELALKVAGMDELMGPRDTFAFTKERMAEFATRLISAYLAEQEPDCWAVLTPNGSKLVSPEEAKGLLKAYPLFTAPPEPSFQHCDTCGSSAWMCSVCHPRPAVCAAPSSDEVDRIVESVKHILATATTVEGYKAGVQILRLMIERLAALTKERDEWAKLKDPINLHLNLLRGVPAKLTESQLRHLIGEQNELAAAQAREAKMLKTISDEATAIAFYGGQPPQWMLDLITLPADDSALQARMKDERERICNMASLNLSERQRDAIRGLA